MAYGFRLLEHRSLKIGIFVRADAGHDADIFCRLILEDEHRIVYSNDPDQAVLMVNDGIATRPYLLIIFATCSWSSRVLA